MYSVYCVLPTSSTMNSKAHLIQREMDTNTLDQSQTYRRLVTTSWIHNGLGIFESELFQNSWRKVSPTLRCNPYPPLIF